MQANFSEQELLRRQAREEIQKLGIDPYPAESVSVDTYTVDIKKEFALKPEKFAHVCMAGRIMSRRIMGNASFAELQDEKGRIQIYIRRDDICPGEDKTLYNAVFKKMIDLGDLVAIQGHVFTTQTGEITVHVTQFRLLTKSLKPLPIVKEAVDDEGNKVVYDAVSDPEFKYRQRYVDLIINQDVRDTFKKRTLLIKTIRDYLNAHGAFEVDTPVLQNIPGGAAARPFVTHHNALDVPFYLRIANELYLKRLIVGGFEFVYEFSRNFRNEGMDRTHNPEFTVLEFYVAYKDYFWMMDFAEKLLESVAIALHGTTVVPVGDKQIDFKAPYKRISIFDAIQQKTGIDISGMDESQLRDVCNQLRISVEPSMGKGKLVDELFSKLCEKDFVQPTFIIDYPVEMSPLTKKHRSKPGLVERFELMVNGKEIANAYSELNDPVDQYERFVEQTKLMERGDDEAMYIDYDFIRALEYGMPPTAGIGIGIDRLCMIMTNQSSIQDVLLFPHMRPEK